MKRQEPKSVHVFREWEITEWHSDLVTVKEPHRNVARPEKFHTITEAREYIANQLWEKAKTMALVGIADILWSDDHDGDWNHDTLKRIADTMIRRGFGPRSDTKRVYR